MWEIFLHKRLEIRIAFHQWEFICPQQQKWDNYLKHSLLIEFVGIPTVKSGQKSELALGLFLFEEFLLGSGPQ